MAAIVTGPGVVPIATAAAATGAGLLATCFASGAALVALGCADKPRSESWVCKRMAIGVLGQCTGSALCGVATGASFLMPETAGKVARYVKLSKAILF